MELEISEEQIQAARKLYSDIKGAKTLYAPPAWIDETNDNNGLKGFVAEMVLADYLAQARPLFTQYHNDGRKDLTINGKRVDVKASAFSNAINKVKYEQAAGKTDV